MRTCDWFDKYRDGELAAAERGEFEAHLAICHDCRARGALLDRVVCLVRSEEVRPFDRAEQIARQAFQRANSWDAEIISWLRPGPAMAAVALLLVLFSSLWLISNNRQTIYPEYEKLMDEVDSVGLASRLSQVRNDNRLVIWQEQEGNTQ
jgi:hypothetical protein